MDTVQRQHLMRSLPWHILCCSIHSNRCSEWRTDWLKLDTTSTNNKNTRQTRAVTSSSNLFSCSQKNVRRNNKLQSDPIESLLSSIPVPFPQLIDSSRKLNSRCGTTFKWTTDPPGLMNGKEFQISCDSIQFVDPLQRAHLLNATGSLSSSLWRGSFSSLSWDNLIDRSRIAADPSNVVGLWRLPFICMAHSSRFVVGFIRLPPQVVVGETWVELPSVTLRMVAYTLSLTLLLCRAWGVWLDCLNDWLFGYNILLVFIIMSPS